MAKSSFLQEGTTNLANEYRFTGGKREGERKHCREREYSIDEVADQVWRKGNPLTPLVEMQTSIATMENNVENS